MKRRDRTKKVTVFQKICRFLLGWLVIPIVAKKNDTLAAIFIGYAMMDWKITKEMKQTKAKYWRWCQWWGIA